MKPFYLALIALLCASSVACAQSDPRAYGARPQRDGQYPAVSSPGLPPLGRIVRNANDCAPDRAEAVWGAGNAATGYACDDSANGS
jgi:hypothetical protein